MSYKPPTVEKFCFLLCPHCSAGLAPLIATLRVRLTCAVNQTTSTMPPQKKSPPQQLEIGQTPKTVCASLEALIAYVQNEQQVPTAPPRRANASSERRGGKKRHGETPRNEIPMLVRGGTTPSVAQQDGVWGIEQRHTLFVGILT